MSLVRPPESDVQRNGDMPLPSPALFAYFIVLVITMVFLWAYLVTSAVALDNVSVLGKLQTFLLVLAVLVAILATELSIAGAGVLAHFDAIPPAIGKLLVPVILVNIYISCFSRLGERLATNLSVRTLVGVQAFRFGPELFLHAGHAEGSLPSQMTAPPQGRNVDALVAAAALGLVLCYRSRPPPRRATWTFAVAGLLSLANIGYTSIRSLTHPIRPADFEAGLEMAALPPYIALPGFLVQIALCCHLVLLRRLLSTSDAPDEPANGALPQKKRSELW